MTPGLKSAGAGAGILGTGGSNARVTSPALVERPTRQTFVGSPSSLKVLPNGCGFHTAKVGEATEGGRAKPTVLVAMSPTHAARLRWASPAPPREQRMRVGSQFGGGFGPSKWR